MPFVLKHADTSQIFTCMLVNHYKLTYYGVKFWEDEEDAETSVDAFLASHAISDAESWKIVDMEEDRMKVCNVRLKNNPDKLLFLDGEGRPVVKSAADVVQ